MNTTFTDEQHAARWLAKFALPFVNATPDQLRKTAFNVYAQNIDKGVCRCDGTDDIVDEFDFERYDIYKRVTDQELTDLQKLIKTMLYIALSDKRYEELPKEIKRQVNRVQKEIEKGIAAISFVALWKGRGEAILARMSHIADGVVSRAKEWFILAITTCLYSYSLTEDIEPMKGAGFDKIGMCPVCGIFFEKIRKDQEACKTKCSNALRQRRFKAKKNI